MNRLTTATLATLGATAIASALVMAIPAASAGAIASDPQAFQAFSHENDVAMDKMMSAMTIKPSGDVDKDFAAMMIPHHAGAIDMALAELRHGKNEQLRRIAQEIIVEQQQEIDAMHLALGDRVASAGPAPTQGGIERVAASASTATPTHHHPSN
jgi:uncharacterized protein (DUF305 family)